MKFDTHIKQASKYHSNEIISTEYHGSETLEYRTSYQILKWTQFLTLQHMQMRLANLHTSKYVSLMRSQFDELYRFFKLCIYGSVQDLGNSIADVLRSLQACTVLPMIQITTSELLRE